MGSTITGGSGGGGAPGLGIINFRSSKTRCKMGWKVQDRMVQDRMVQDRMVQDGMDGAR